MIDILNLALPYFGLIFVGFLCGKFRRLPEAGLAWMNFFLLYVSLPALFFRILAKTPFSELNNPPFILATTLATAAAFVLAATIARLIGRLRGRDTAMAGLAGGYGNIGYMGPGLALATLGTGATVPVALIFCFDTVFLFSVVPLIVALSGDERGSPGALIGRVAKQILLHPLMVASYLGALAAALQFNPPEAVDGMLRFLQSAAAPVALFVLGVTVALRPFDRVPWEVPAVIAVKLVLHPLIVFGLLIAFGPFAHDWAATALLMASLPPALNTFIIARQYEAWVEPASAAVLLGTFVSVLTLTTMMFLLRSGQLPVP
jgi:predicted permease